MAEYIEREAAYALSKKICDAIRNHKYHPATFGHLILDWIDDLPAADVQPVRHGRWHSRFFCRESTKAYDCEMHVCNECGSEWSYDAETGSSDFNYCPNCGAKML